MGTDINESHRTDYGISIYPNPFHTSATVSIKSSVRGTHKGISFNLYDVLGREAINMLFHNSTSTLYKKDLPNGMYYYKLRKGTDVIDTGKLIIQ